MVCLKLTVGLILSTLVYGETKKTSYHQKHYKQIMIALSKGTQCYNCLSLDSPGCWDPDHPDNNNVTVPSVDCHMSGVQFACIIITAESSEIMKIGSNTGPVRVRTCIPVKRFFNTEVSYTRCDLLSKELQHSQIFTKVKVFRPKCQLCRGAMCTS